MLSIWIHAGLFPNGQGRFNRQGWGKWGEQGGEWPLFVWSTVNGPRPRSHNKGTIYLRLTVTVTPTSAPNLWAPLYISSKSVIIWTSKIYTLIGRSEWIANTNRNTLHYIGLQPRFKKLYSHYCCFSFFLFFSLQKQVVQWQHAKQLSNKLPLAVRPLECVFEAYLFWGILSCKDVWTLAIHLISAVRSRLPGKMDLGLWPTRAGCTCSYIEKNRDMKQPL